MKTKQIETNLGLLDVVIEEEWNKEDIHIRVSLIENIPSKTVRDTYLAVLFNHAKELVNSLLKREPLPLPSPEKYKEEMEDMERLMFLNPKKGTITIALYDGELKEFRDEFIFNEKLNSIEFNLVKDEDDEDEVYTSCIRSVNLIEYEYKDYEDFFLKHKKEDDDRCLSFYRKYDDYYYIGSIDDDIFHEINSTLVLLYQCLKENYLYWDWGVERAAKCNKDKNLY